MGGAGKRNMGGVLGWGSSVPKRETLYPKPAPASKRRRDDSGPSAAVLWHAPEFGKGKKVAGSKWRASRQPGRCIGAAYDFRV